MLLAAVALSQLLNVCAPGAGRRTMAAIVRVESNGNPLAIHDNDLNRTFMPHDVNQGVVWADQLLALHHSVDLGISQINAFNLPRLGLSVRDAFDPCMNVHGGATILASNYRAAALQFGAGQFALRRAIGAYNSGSLYAGSTYIHRILEAAGIDADEGFAVPDLQVDSQPLSAAQLGQAPRPVARTARVAPAAAPTANPFAAPLLVGTPAALGPPPVAAARSNAANHVPTPIVLRVSDRSPQGSPILAATPVARPISAPSPTSTPGASPAQSSTPKFSPTPRATGS
jgi:type IV secretion system protein VirB1